MKTVSVVSNNALRKVPYSNDILEEVKKIQGDNIFIFGTIDDAGLLRRNICLDTGIKRNKLYSTRHTFATLMLKEDINELAGLLRGSF